MTRTRGIRVLLWTLGWLVGTANAAAQPDVSRAEFLRWVNQNLHAVSDASLDASTRDLAPIEKMISAACIVGLSEGIHAGAEPLIFRNRLFKYLVEHAGFNAIALESGVVEGRILNEYVTRGTGDFDDVLANGLSNGFQTFQQNRDLVRWMREYNLRAVEPVQIFGIDVPGSPGNFDSTRRPDTALRTVLDYLHTVDPQAAAKFQARVEPVLPALESINDYAEVRQPERDALTAAISDLIATLERQQHVYAAKRSRDDFEWALRTAIGARQTDTWFRHMPVGWKLDDGLAWTREAMQVRDRTMADNLEWVRGRLGPGARVLVFTAVGHMATTGVKMPTSPFGEMTPFGTYAKDRYGGDFVNILNLVAGGEIHYCSANPRRVMPLQPPPEGSVEAWFTGADQPRYLLDLRRAPASIASWLREPHDHWNGFAVQQFATSQAFDLVYFVRPVSPACVPQVEATR